MIRSDDPPTSAISGAGPALLPPAAVSRTGSAPPPGADPEDVALWFDLETIVDLPAPAVGFAEAEAAAAAYRCAARADNTRRAYRAAVARFCDWCAAHGRMAIPATAETVAAFLAAEAGQGLAVNTLRLRHAAIRYWHLLAGYPPPTTSPLVSATFAGIRRAHRRPLRKKTALVLDPLRAAVQAIPDTLPGLRDRALLLIGFAAALRPSELARLDVVALTRHQDGVVLLLPWRKNDQEGEGTTVWLPVGRTDLCPVTALDAWLSAAQITEGPLFRRLWRLPPPRIARGTSRKPVADRYRHWYQSDRHRFDRADRQKMDRPSRARRHRLCRPQPKTRSDFERGCAGRPYRPAEAVLRPCLAQKPRRITRARRA